MFSLFSLPPSLCSFHLPHHPLHCCLAKVTDLLQLQRAPGLAHCSALRALQPCRAQLRSDCGAGISGPMHCAYGVTLHIGGLSNMRVSNLQGVFSKHPLPGQPVSPESLHSQELALSLLFLPESGTGA